MRKLELVGLSDDGRQVILVDDTGAEFATPADDRLRAVLRGDRARLGQLEIQMDSALRPRDIQARIRAGESPEAVATLAQVSVDKIMAFCVPVLAEREHIADLAQRSHVRRKNADGPARRLADVVAERLRGRGLDPTLTQWDAWRRDDARWSVNATYHSGERERSALFAFDAVGRYSVADDDEAKWLTGEKQDTRKGPQPREAGGRERRLSAVPDGDDDLLSLSERADAEGTDDLTAVVRAVRERDEQAGEDERAGAAGSYDEGVVTEAARETDADSATDTDGADTADDAEDAAAQAATTEVAAPEGQREPDVEQAPASAKRKAGRGRKSRTASSEPATEPTPERKRRQKRASVPSWDEIMFGGKEPKEGNGDD